MLISLPQSLKVQIHTLQILTGACFGTQECFLSTLQNMGVRFWHAAEIFHHGKVFFVQAAYNFFHAAKMHFVQLWLELFLGICTKNFKKCQL